MIEVYPDNTTSCPVGTPQSREGTLAARFIMPVTRHLRTRYAVSGLVGRESHLDIGCGDCHFLFRSPCEKRVGLDLRYGDDVEKGLEFPDESFANVSMLASIEHLERPGFVIEEVYRVLKSDGRFIITTPKKKAERLIGISEKDVTEVHKGYFDVESIKRLTNGRFDLLVYRPFLFALNQLFVLRKRSGHGN